jgi:hypothetical protein
MGILDDAIRQHLELKRQHGASEDEIQRQEEEALGPARRDVVPAEPAGEEADEVLEEAPVADAASEQETELYEPATAGSATAAEQETQLYEPPSARPESDTAAEPETAFEGERETAFDPERETAFEPERDTGFEPARETAFEPERDTGFEPERETAFEPEPDTAFEPEPEDEPAPADEPDDEAVPQPEELPPSPAPFDASSAYDDFTEEDEQESEEPEGAEGDVLEDTPDFLQETPEHDRLWFEQRPPRDFDFD